MGSLISTASTAVDYLKKSFGRNTPIFRPKPVLPGPMPCSKCGAMLQPVLWDYDEIKLPNCKACELTDILNYIQKEMADILGFRGLPKRFQDARLSDFGDSYPKRRPERGLFIPGPRGVGKTHLAAALMRAEVDAWIPPEYEREKGRLVLSKYYDDPRDDFGEYRYPDFPLFVSASELLLKIRSTFGRHEGKTEEDILEKYSEVPVLFLDDLGAENPTTWATSTLFILIDRRYSRELKTYITSNLGLGDLAVRLDDRITSRIAEMCKVFKMTGDDRRLKRPA